MRAVGTELKDHSDQVTLRQPSCPSERQFLGRDLESQPSREMSLQLLSHDSEATGAVPPTSGFGRILPVHPDTVEFLPQAGNTLDCDTE